MGQKTNIKIPFGESFPQSCAAMGVFCYVEELRHVPPLCFNVTRSLVENVIGHLFICCRTILH